MLISHNLVAGRLKKIKSFGNNQGNLNCYLYIPKNYTNTAPLVVALHGCNQSVEGMAYESEWNKIAEQYGFIVLYPSQKVTNNPSRCFNWFEKSDTQKNSGESASIIAMIDYVIATYSIDTSKIYVYGLSAGAVMSVALLANYPAYFKAGAVYSGCPYNAIDNPLQALNMMKNSTQKSAYDLAQEIVKINTDTNTSYPKLVVLHGKKDRINTIKNAYILINEWAYLCNTDTIVDNIEFNYEKIELSRKVYQDKSKNEKIVFYEFENTGHWISVNPGIANNQGGQAGLFAHDDDFFSTYWIAKEFELITEKK